MERYTLPTIPLRGVVIFPNVTVGMDIKDKRSQDHLNGVMEKDRLIFFVTQRNIDEDDLCISDLYKIGTIARVKQVLKLPGNAMHAVVEGMERARIIELHSDWSTTVELCGANDGVRNYVADMAFVKNIQENMQHYLEINRRFPAELAFKEISEGDLDTLTDVVAAHSLGTYKDKQDLLETLDVYKRAQKVSATMLKEITIMRCQQRIDEKVRSSIDKEQREHYLQEQMRAIKEELNDRYGQSEEMLIYQNAIANAKIQEPYFTKLMNEVDKLSMMQPSSPEAAVLTSYLDIVTKLPWRNESKENLSVENAEAILEEDHYGLNEVKKRILEHLAVHKRTKGKQGTVLCFVGPPGTGKTSIARSIARALNRQYVRISLGGVRDEADIRGHRKTYIASMPGRIMNAVMQAGTKNPLILLDELDKMGKDYNGDPASAMLEVLDIEQNKEFRDHYIEVPFDLSKVMFIATANTLNGIPAPLLDRIEVIEISGYTEEEKTEIAKRHLIPKQQKKHGLEDIKITVNDDTVHEIIEKYTRESGVRNLERRIAALMRRIAIEIDKNGKKSVTVGKRKLADYLGKPRYDYDMMNKKDEVGIVRGLAWTSVGGDTLSVEVNVMEGSGKVELTGNLGDVMRESAMTAISYVRSASKKLNIAESFYKTKDIHIHVPQGAVPKDGPSAGITIATAVASALSETPVRRDVAMTGEITLRGRVLPIGGLKEKSLAAYRAGIKTVIIPEENKRDIEEIPEDIRSKMDFIPVSGMDRVLKTAFVR